MRDPKVGDKVVPADTFDFVDCHGPRDSEDVGVVEELWDRRLAPLVIVSWRDSGLRTDHTIGSYIGLTDEGQNVEADGAFSVELLEGDDGEGDNETVEVYGNGGLKIGDRVRPVTSFDFGFYNGPGGLDDIGTVTGFDWEGDPFVLWDEGEDIEAVHVTRHSRFMGGESFPNFGVVPAVE